MNRSPYKKFVEHGDLVVCALDSAGIKRQGVSTGAGCVFEQEKFNPIPPPSLHWLIPRKGCPDLTEKMMTGMFIHTKQTHKH